MWKNSTAQESITLADSMVVEQKGPDIAA